MSFVKTAGFEPYVKAAGGAGGVILVCRYRKRERGSGGTELFRSNDDDSHAERSLRHFLFAGSDHSTPHREPPEAVGDRVVWVLLMPKRPDLGRAARACALHLWGYVPGSAVHLSCAAMHVRCDRS